jgi:hypothetical protein
MRKIRRQRRKERVSPASAFLRLVNCVSPASAFRHQGESGTASHGLVRHCPALPGGKVYWKKNKFCYFRFAKQNSAHAVLNNTYETKFRVFLLHKKAEFWQNGRLFLIVTYIPRNNVFNKNLKPSFKFNNFFLTYKAAIKIIHICAALK